MKHLCAILLVLALSLSAMAFSQDKAAKEMPKKGDKMEMTKAEKEMGPLKTLSCDPQCGFMVRSRDEKEVMSVAKAHAKKVHNMTMTDKQVKDMMKTEGDAAK
jgi:predicted small metal-binding protein